MTKPLASGDVSAVMPCFLSMFDGRKQPRWQRSEHHMNFKTGYVTGGLSIIYIQYGLHDVQEVLAVTDHEVMRSNNRKTQIEGTQSQFFAGNLYRQFILPVALQSI